MPDHVDEQWGWDIESVDWSYWWDEAHRVGRVLYNRHDWVHTPRRGHGHAARRRAARRAQDGLQLPRHQRAAHAFGTWMRSLFTGGDRHEPHRRLKEKRKLHELPRAEPPEGVPSAQPHRRLHGRGGQRRGPVDAAWEALHYNDHQTRCVALFEACRLGVGTVDRLYDYGAELAPQVFGPSTGEVPGASRPGARPTSRAKSARYIAYDTLLCYLYPPPTWPAGRWATARPSSCTTRTARASR